MWGNTCESPLVSLWSKCCMMGSLSGCFICSVCHVSHLLVPVGQSAACGGALRGQPLVPGNHRTSHFVIFSKMSFSFYKLLVTPDFDSKLRLPPQFVKDHAEVLLRKATLRIESGESWIVKIERIEQHHFFTEGWEKFSRDVDLKFQQFMLFWFDGESGFRVSVYGMSGCERELRVCNTWGGSENSEHGDGHGDIAVKLESGDEDDAKIDEERGFRAGKQWRFRAKLKKNHETELEVPGDFAKATGIAENGRIFLLTRHPKTKKWPVFVTARKQDRDQSFAMTVGWNDFLVGSKVCVGGMILFEFLSNKDNIIIEAKVVKNGKKGLFSPKKRRGRPPKFSKF